MADSRGAPTAVAKAGGALFALVYVLPLTGAMLFALAMAPALMPHGWPAGVARQVLALLWSALRRTLARYQGSLTDAAHALGDACSSHQFVTHSLYLSWSLVFLLGIVLVRFSAKRRTL